MTRPHTNTWKNARFTALLKAKNLVGRKDPSALTIANHWLVCLHEEGKEGEVKEKN